MGKDNRKPYSAASPELLQFIDHSRGVNEIPLQDNDTKEVLYGIDALVAIIGQRCPFVRALGTVDPVKWLLKKIDNFISYNRKVIVARKTIPGTMDCTPDFNMFYRVLFMGVFLLFNTVMLFPIHAELIERSALFSISLSTFHIAHAAVVSVNCCLALRLGAGMESMLKNIGRRISKVRIL